MRNGIEHGLVTLLVLFDFKRAFDTLSRVSLLRALCSQKIGFSPSAFRFVHSYISGRKAVVSHTREMSEFCEATSGVTQGSPPDPISLLILINYLPSRLRFCKFSYILFADDLQLFIQCPPNLIASAIAHMNEDAQYVTDWAQEYGLTLNTSKTKAIIFESDENLAYIESLPLP